MKLSLAALWFCLSVVLTMASFKTNYGPASVVFIVSAIGLLRLAYIEWESV